jgi:hypothetical protein
MAIVVVGGHSRKVGKTSVTAALIGALPEYSWTASKLSSHWHAEPGEVCAIQEEKDRAGATDSSRYLAAGALRSFWVQVREERAAEAMARLLPVLQSSRFLIIESNCILKYLRPDLYIMVLRYGVDEFKESARETLEQVDAVVAWDSGVAPPSWSGLVRDRISRIPVFETSDPSVLPAGLIELVRSRISRQA